ncbi:DUF2871 domain-containing protein [Clostridium estertheticum]|uniref:DUF2871 domain-containing protein n=1 Tax=Clostridium estertheticum TaxID=238834 RepID=UPI0013E92117|nr:DUF2871 domain-containing protein [Clostridium estertheticum]MBZ9689853.1 DUF2871 domain-containing protein [Clostridium estertheticum]
MKKLYNSAFIYLLIGALAGVFFREFTKINNYTGKTTLSVVHTHFLVLGFLFFLILTLTYPILNFDKIKNFNKWFITYNIGLLLTGSTMLARGVLQVTGADFNGLSHIAGTAHAILGISLFWFMFILKKALEDYSLK